ncbi:MAG: RNA polymerase sigma factor [Saprospiraceae bacterium]|nr:RNA polymerase sigma factor [Candidatus Defluviibacterium haderslevense]MBK7245262.1 RNA polymerase sigma factor [Candidatus Defluviibacterium haderslevense]
MELSITILNNESELIEACIRKETWAQQRVYEEHYTKMLGVCLRYANSQDDALDILHDGFLKVFLNIHSYEIGTQFSAWIRRIMVNTSIDYYRKEHRRITSDIDDAKTLTVYSSNPIDTMTLEEVMGAMQKLSPTYRSVLNLYVVDGYSHKEVSEMLGITESTSRSNLVKARQKLKEILKEGNGE